MICSPSVLFVVKIIPALCKRCDTSVDLVTLVDSTLSHFPVQSDFDLD